MNEDLRFGSALWIVLTGLVVIALLAFFLPVKDGWMASDVTTLIGALTTFLGTIVGAFLGVQAGAAGKGKAEDLAKRALAELSPEAADRVLKGK